ncbi:lipopolysaccharide biosynthesis protein [Polaribacter sp.]|nr:lipopolysaccharide biosynthesis protein [Polaribacter sp.]
MKKNFKTFAQFFTLSFGSLFSLLINIIVLIVFSRVYSKEHFGDYAIFVSVASLLSILCTFRIEHLIVLKKTNREAALLSKLCKKIINYFTCIVFCFSILLYISSVPFFNKSSFTWFLIPISVFCFSNIIIFLSWNNKIKNYKLISKFKIVQSLSVGLIGIVFSFLSKDFGLIIAHVFGLITSYILFNFRYKKFIKKYDFNPIKINDIKTVFLENKRYIKTSFGLEFFNTISKYIPNFILNAYYGNGIVGIYDMTLKVLNIPKNIISLNIGELYYQKASIFYYKSKEKFSKITVQTFYMLFFAGILCYSPFVFFGEELFVFVLGDEWRLSGVISEIIVFWMMLLFVSSPMAYIFYIRRTLSNLFRFTFFSFIIKTSVLFYLTSNNSKIETISFYMYTCIFLELVLIFIILKQRGEE